MNSPTTQNSHSKNTLKQQGLVAAFLSLLGACVVLVVFVRLELIDKMGDSAFIAMLVMPLIAFMVVFFSDRVSEVSGGGISVKLSDLANAEVEARPTSADVEADVGPIQVIRKSSLTALRERRETLRPGDKVAVTLQFEKQNYSAQDVHEYLNVLLAQDADMPVIFVDDGGRFVASTMAVKLRDALSQMGRGNASSRKRQEVEREFIDAIRLPASEGVERLSSIVTVTKTSLPPGTTNSEALSAMISEDAGVLVSVDDERRPVGVVRKDAIVSKLLAALVE